MKSAFLAPVIFLVFALGAYVFMPDARIMAVIFLVFAVLSLLLVPASIRTGKKIDTLKKMIDEKQNRP